MPSVSTKPPLWAALPCPALRQRQRSGSSWLHLLVEKVDLERPLLRRQRDPVLDVLFAGQPRRDRCRVFERSQFVPRCFALLCVALHRYSRARALPCNGSPASPQQADRYCAVLLGHSRLSGPEGSEDRCCGPQCTVCTLRYFTVLYGAIQSSTVLSTTVCCQYSRRTVELRVVVQQRERTEVALVERERQRPRAALGGIPQQRQVDLPASGIPTYAAANSAVPTYAEAAAGRSAIQSVEVIATVTTVAGTATSPKVSTHV